MPPLWIPTLPKLYNPSHWVLAIHSWGQTHPWLSIMTTLVYPSFSTRSAPYSWPALGGNIQRNSLLNSHQTYLLSFLSFPCHPQENCIAQSFRALPNVFALVGVGWALGEQRLHSEISVFSHNASLFLARTTCSLCVGGRSCSFLALRTWADSDLTSGSFITWNAVVPQNFLQWWKCPVCAVRCNLR